MECLARFLWLKYQIGIVSSTIYSVISAAQSLNDDLHSFTIYWKNDAQLRLSPDFESLSIMKDGKRNLSFSFAEKKVWAIVTSNFSDDVITNPS